MSDKEVRVEQRNYWVWSTHPTEDHVVALNSGEGEWTCHKDTLKGDLALVYLTGPRSQLAYLVGATSKARPPKRAIRNSDTWDGHPSCDFKTHAIFTQPLTFGKMMADPFLASKFSALRAYFRRSAYGVSTKVWNHLMNLLITANPSTEADVRRSGALDT